MRTAVRDLRLPFPVRLPVLCSGYRRGPYDPCVRLTDRELWWAQRRADGPVLLHVEVTAAGVRGQAWGPAADAAVAELDEVLGAGDEPAEFRPRHRAVAELHRSHPQLRLGRHRAVFDTLAAVAIEQRVTSRQAHRAWSVLVTRFGIPAPRPAGAPALTAPPEPEAWLSIPDWTWRRAGVEGRRAAVVRGAASCAGRLESLASTSSAEADRVLRSLPGVGTWTSAEVRQRTHGDPDAVAVGDWHLPRDVGVAFTGRPADDAGMLELLAPFTGHRHRVIRLIGLAGIRAPRRGPRLPVVDVSAS